MIDSLVKVHDEHEPNLKPISVPLSLLLDPNNETLGPLLHEAFSSSPTSLGVLIISDLPPSFVTLRERVLHLSNAFASLPETTRELYADPSSHWSFGWSLGKETMNGKRDVSKGSYYNNPTHDTSPGLKKGESDFNNIWPDEITYPTLKGFKQTFMDICRIMVDIGAVVAKACDELVRTETGRKGMANQKTVEQLIKESRGSKARLLHYFPPEGQVFQVAPPPTAPSESDESEQKKASAKAVDIDDSWCGTHIDFSILTALCPAMYLFHPTSNTTLSTTSVLSPIVIPSPNSDMGLYVKSRNGKVMKAVIPENCIAFQTGETIELLSSGRLAATPHFVNGTRTNLFTPPPPPTTTLVTSTVKNSLSSNSDPNSHANGESITTTPATTTSTPPAPPPTTTTTTTCCLGSEAYKVILNKKRQDPTWEHVETGVVSRETLAVFLQPNNHEVISNEGEMFGQFAKRVLARHY